MRSSVSVKQIRPRPCMAMKLIASGVTFSAARQRTPAFSRSSSSTRMTILPRAMSSIAPLTLSNDTRFLSISDLAVIIEQLLQAAFLGSIRFSGQAARVEEAGDVAGDHVCFEVHGVARAFFTEVRHLRGVRDDHYREGAIGASGDRQADAFDGDRAARYGELEDFFGRFEFVVVCVLV